jgi:uncharacterized delta-60 repeat protein
MKKFYLLFGMLSMLNGNAQVGTLDSTFGSNGWATSIIPAGPSRMGTEQFVRDVATQPDGKTITLFATRVTRGPSYEEPKNLILVRHLKNGAIDYSFGKSGYSLVNRLFAVYTELEVLPNGDILVGGNEMFTYGNFQFSVLRFHPNGELNTDFGNGGTASVDFNEHADEVAGMAVQQNGKIVLVGISSKVLNPTSPNKNFAAARFLPNGQPDPAFGAGGKILFDVGETNYRATDVVVQQDGKIVVGGVLTDQTGPHFTLGRMNHDGTQDAGFGFNGIVVTQKAPNTSLEELTSLALQPDGKILAGGYANGWQNDVGIARFNVNGTLDASFGINGVQITDIPQALNVVGRSNDAVEKILVQKDGKIFAIGTSYWQVGTFTYHNFIVLRYTSNGFLDPQFDSDGVVFVDFLISDDHANGATITEDGKIVVAGSSVSGTYGESFYALTRINPDGALDNSWSGDGLMADYYPDRRRNTGFNSIAVQKDGKVVAVGFAAFPEYLNNYNYYLARFNKDGTPDPQFIGAGREAGKVVTKFGREPGRDAEALSVAIQPDGKILVAGMTHDLTTNSSDIIVARYLENGFLDITFGAEGQVIIDRGKVITDMGSAVERANAIALQKDGKIIVGGVYGRMDGNDFALLRYNADGTLDQSFDQDGIITTDFGGDDNIFSIAVQPDGKIVAGGFASKGYIYDFAVARYNTDGSLDQSFGKEGKQVADLGFQTELGYSLALQADGKIVMAGDVEKPGNNNSGLNRDFGLIRLNKDGSMDNSFGSGGKKLVDISGWDHAASLKIQPDGKMLIGGSVKFGTPEDLVMLRLHKNGSFDKAFGKGGFTVTNLGTFEAIRSIAIDKNRVYGGGTYDGQRDGVALMAAFKMGPVAPVLSIENITVSEDLGTAHIQVRLSDVSNLPVILQTSSIDGTAQHGQDYKKVKGLATIPIGSLETSIVVTIRNDNKKEGPEYFDLELTPVFVAPDVVLEDLKGRVTITDATRAIITEIKGSNSIRNSEPLQANVWPNPSADLFTLQFTGGTEERVFIKIWDAVGKMKEHFSLGSSARVQFGHSYPGGIYYVEVVQGNSHMILKVIKAER